MVKSWNILKLPFKKAPFAGGPTFAGGVFPNGLFHPNKPSQATLLPYRGGSIMASIPGPTKVPRPAFHKSNLRSIRCVSNHGRMFFCFPGLVDPVVFGVCGVFCWGFWGRNLQTGGFCFFWLEQNATKKKETFTVSKKSRMILICFMKGSCNKKYVCCKCNKLMGAFPMLFVMSRNTKNPSPLVDDRCITVHFSLSRIVSGVVHSVQYTPSKKTLSTACKGKRTSNNYVFRCFLLPLLGSVGDKTCSQSHWDGASNSQGL